MGNALYYNLEPVDQKGILAMSLNSRRVGNQNGRARLFLAAVVLICPLLLMPITAFAQDATPEITPAPEVTTLPETTEVPAAPEVTEPAPEATSVPVSVPLQVVGSGLAMPLVNALASAAGVDLPTQVTGTTSGITAFCNGQASGVVATRALTAQEEALCAQNGVIFGEALIAHSAAALIVNPGMEFAQCFSTADLATLFAPSATAVTWNQVQPTYLDQAITIALPPTTTPAYNVLDQVIEGDGLRVDTTPLADEAAVVEAVSSTSGAVGIVSQAVAAAADESVRIVELNSAEAGCIAPSAESIEASTYIANQPVLFYYNTAGSAEQISVLSYVASDASAETVANVGFTFPTADARAELTSALESGTVGRTYSLVETTFSILPSVSGAVTIGGAANEFAYITDLTTAFTGTYTGVTTDINVEGTTAGVRRFCNGELDILVTFAPLTAEQLEPCTANNVTPYPIALGSQGVIIARNSADSFAQCLTTTQLSTIFGAAASNTVTNWNQVDPSYPDLPLFVFEPSLGNSSVNLLLVRSSGTNDPGRSDAQINADPLYRAAATAGNSGVLSVYNWLDWELAHADYPDLVPVAVDAGAGCVEPTASTIGDNSYPISRPFTLVINRASLAKPQVQSLLWYALSDENYLAIQFSGLAGLEFGDLAEIRAELQDLFTVVTEEAVIAAEATPDPSAAAEATPEATAEATEAAGS